MHFIALEHDSHHGEKARKRASCLFIHACGWKGVATANSIVWQDLAQAEIAKGEKWRHGLDNREVERGLNQSVGPTGG